MAASSTFRDKQKAATRAKIIGAVRDAIVAGEYDAMTMRSLATSIGMSTGAIFAHFTGKDELFEAATGYAAPTAMAYMELVEFVAIVRHGDMPTVAIGDAQDLFEKFHLGQSEIVSKDPTT